MMLIYGYIRLIAQKASWISEATDHPDTSSGPSGSSYWRFCRLGFDCSLFKVKVWLST